MNMKRTILIMQCILERDPIWLGAELELFCRSDEKGREKITVGNWLPFI